MNICGIELKANNVILVVLKNNEYIDIKIKKLILEDDEKQEDIRKFCNEFLDFLQKNEIEKVKLVLPKDSVLALNAAHDEILHRMNLHRDYCESLSIPLEKTQRDFTLELADEYINGTWSNPVSGPFIK